MFQAVCNDCHKSCNVPFRPTGDKPVYCSDCFGSHRIGSDDRGDRGRRDGRGEQDRFSRREYAPAPRREFTPSFVAKAPMGDKRIDELKRQLDVISAKVDTIFRIVSGKTLVVTEDKKQLKKEVDKESVAESLKNMMADAKKSEKKIVKKMEKKSVKKVKKITKKKSFAKKK
jgi:CxxC-x17-CxxC domain-containing protein